MKNVTSPPLSEAAVREDPRIVTNDASIQAQALCPL